MAIHVEIEYKMIYSLTMIAEPNPYVAHSTVAAQTPRPPKSDRQIAMAVIIDNKTVGAVRKRQKHVRKFLTSPNERRTGSTATSKSCS